MYLKQNLNKQLTISKPFKTFQVKQQQLILNGCVMSRRSTVTLSSQKGQAGLHIPLPLDIRHSARPLLQHLGHLAPLPIDATRLFLGSNVNLPHRPHGSVETFQPMNTKLHNLRSKGQAKLLKKFPKCFYSLKSCRSGFSSSLSNTTPH